MLRGLVIALFHHCTTPPLSDIDTPLPPKYEEQEGGLASEALAGGWLPDNSDINSVITCFA